MGFEGGLMEHRGDESGVRGRTSPATARNAMLVMLSLAAGCVDAVGFLGLGQIFVANMTGNTVLLGLALGQARGEAALRPVVSAAVSGERGEEHLERTRPSARGLVLPADVWLAYGIGAVIVGIIAVRWPSGVLSVPVAVVALVVAIAVARFRRRW
jgi:uncharacterized membrane protein YoaK (UPF0700 family)